MIFKDKEIQNEIKELNNAIKGLGDSLERYFSKINELYGVLELKKQEESEEYITSLLPGLLGLQQYVSIQPLDADTGTPDKDRQQDFFAGLDKETFNKKTPIPSIYDIYNSKFSNFDTVVDIWGYTLGLDYNLRTRLKERYRDLLVNNPTFRDMVIGGGYYPLEPFGSSFRNGKVSDDGEEGETIEDGWKDITGEGEGDKGDGNGKDTKGRQTTFSDFGGIVDEEDNEKFDDNSEKVDISRPDNGYKDNNDNNNDNTANTTKQIDSLWRECYNRQREIPSDDSQIKLCEIYEKIIESQEDKQEEMEEIIEYFDYYYDQLDAEKEQSGETPKAPPPEEKTSEEKQLPVIYDEIFARKQQYIDLLGRRRDLESTLKEMQDKYNNMKHTTGLNHSSRCAGTNTQKFEGILNREELELKIPDVEEEIEDISKQIEELYKKIINNEEIYRHITNNEELYKHIMDNF